MKDFSRKIFVLLSESLIFLLAMGLHAFAIFALLNSSRQVGAIESEVASISMNLAVTTIIEEKIQGDIEGEPDPQQAMEPPPLVKMTKAAKALHQPEEEEIKPEAEPAPEPKVKPEPAPELEIKPESEPVPEPEIKPEAEPAPEPEVKPEPAPVPEPKVKPEPEPVLVPEIKPKPVAKPVVKPKRQKKRLQRPKKKKTGRKKRKGYLAKVNAPGRLVRGATRAAMRGPRATSTGARLSLRRVRSYGSLVRARIARYRPRGGASKGRTVISFSLASSGSLRRARIVRSCGNAKLDRAALAAVRKAAPFPRPPAGMSARQLRFAIPFSFR